MFSSDAMSTSFTNHLQFRPKYCNFPLNLEITTNTSDFLLNFGKGKFKERSLSRFNRFFESKTQSSVDEGRSTNSCDCSLSGANEKESENGIEEEDDSFDLTQEIDLTDQDASELFVDVDLEGWINHKVTPLRGFAEHFNLIGAYCGKSAGYQAREVVHEDVAKVAWSAIEKQNVILALNVVKTLCEIPDTSIVARQEGDWLLFNLLVFLLHQRGVFSAHVAMEIFTVMETYFSVPCPERVRFEKAVFILRHNLLEDQFIKPLNDRLHAAIGIVKHQQILKNKQELDHTIKTLLEATQFSIDQDNEDFDASLRLELAIEELEQFFLDFENGETELSSELGNAVDFVPYLVDLKCLKGLRHEGIEILQSYLEKFPQNVNLQMQLDVLQATDLF